MNIVAAGDGSKARMSMNRYGLPDSQEAAAMTGREFLQAIVDGRFPQPPIGQTLSFWIAGVGDGFAVFEGDPGAQLCNPMGVVHGGWALTLLDSATGCAAHSLLPPGVGSTSIETKVNFSRAIRPDTGRVRAEGRVVSQGRQIISTEGKLFAPDGRVLAHGTSTVFVLSNDR
ncbi:MAG: PaaI family thioesterase [Candidatus Acidiferrum sp.]